MIALQFDIGKLVEICRKNDITKLSVFGSMARGEANDQSDIDLLVEFSKRKSLLAVVALEQQIAAIFGGKTSLYF
ncbi:MAG: nucleotidyltransferase domain-containing protein [Chloroflexi bacterium]|nr:nucleotidyltransferase domain-containing protein [Chloroflexota bacterium]